MELKKWIPIAEGLDFCQITEKCTVIRDGNGKMEYFFNYFEEKDGNLNDLSDSTFAERTIDRDFVIKTQSFKRMNEESNKLTNSLNNIFGQQNDAQPSIKKPLWVDDEIKKIKEDD